MDLEQASPMDDVQVPVEGNQFEPETTDVSVDGLVMEVEEPTNEKSAPRAQEILNDQDSCMNVETVGENVAEVPDPQASETDQRRSVEAEALEKSAEATEAQESEVSAGSVKPLVDETSLNLERSVEGKPDESKVSEENDDQKGDEVRETADGEDLELEQACQAPRSEAQLEPEVQKEDVEQSAAEKTTVQPAIAVVHVPAAVLEKIDKPKKAVSSFWIFSNAMREKVADEHHRATGSRPKFGELAKIMSAKWSSMPDEERRVWDDKASADKQRYDAQMQVFEAGRDPCAALRLKFQHLIPKKPASPYFMFCQDAAQREKAAEALKAEGKDASNKSIATKLAELWKVASVEDKTGYQEEVCKQNLEFLEKQKVWQTTPEYLELCQAEKQQELLNKAVAAAKAREEAERLEREERQKRAEKKRKTIAAKVEVTPAAKKSRGSAPVATQTPPKVSTRSKGTAPVAGPRLDEKVLAEAKKLGMEESFRNMSARPEVLASGKPARAILGALRASGGLVNPAKRALLGL